MPEPLPADTAADTGEAAHAAPSTPTPTPPTKQPPAEQPDAGPYQQLQIMTDPAGATAMLDGLGDVLCQTPCKLQARKGTHTLTLKKEGYQTESREIHVENENVDVPIITLRSSNGILLLTSDPSSRARLARREAYGFRDPSAHQPSCRPATRFHPEKRLAICRPG